MADDRDDRRRETNAYLDRRDDQLSFEKTQLENNEAIHKAIRDRNDPGVYLKLGITPPDSSDTDDLSDYQEENGQRSGEEEFDEHAEKLRIALRYSQALPSRLTRAWWGRIRAIDVYQPSSGLEILDEILQAYAVAVEEFKPRRDIFNLAISETMRFDREMREIKFELDALRILLSHFEAYLKENPLSRG
ncbi:MAG TPA: hypothetical protein VGX92_18660 [Pyrinomonadaceae bacterium]|jgi:hypothetical protein|nr:hypothetical protein [Pyrinomonadaceae bacterium]